MLGACAPPSGSDTDSDTGRARVPTRLSALLAAAQNPKYHTGSPARPGRQQAPHIGFSAVQNCGATQVTLGCSRVHTSFDSAQLSNYIPPTENPNMDRRSFVAAASAGAALTVCAGETAKSWAASPAPPQKSPAFRYCLNTSTINNSQVPIRQQLAIAAKAGYDGVEIWLRDIETFVNEGGTLTDLRKEATDLGLTIESAIAFGAWIVDDAEQRKAGLDQCKKDMETLREIGGTRIAAPPTGATRGGQLDLRAAAERYRTLLEIGARTEVLPQIELWGFSQNLSRLEELLFVAAGAMHPDACILLDVYHMYKGGSDFTNLDLVPGKKMHCLHMNDYPDIGRDQISDADRVYPGGDGIAPLDKILQTLVAGGFAGTLSLELFNRSYWERPAATVAKMGIEKMKAAVESAFS